MTPHTWHLTYDMWHFTPDMWYVKHRGWWTLSENFMSLALMVWECLGGADQWYVGVSIRWVVSGQPVFLDSHQLTYTNVNTEIDFLSWYRFFLRAKLFPGAVDVVPIIWICIILCLWSVFAARPLTWRPFTSNLVAPKPFLTKFLTFFFWPAACLSCSGVRLLTKNLHYILHAGFYAWSPASSFCAQAALLPLFPLWSFWSPCPSCPPELVAYAC